jgi:hypothetical protein
MNTQPVFLKIGLNYPHQQRRRDQTRLLIHALCLLILALVILSSYLGFCLRQSWRNERALSESVNQLTPKWP